MFIRYAATLRTSAALPVKQRTFDKNDVVFCAKSMSTKSVISSRLPTGYSNTLHSDSNLRTDTPSTRLGCQFYQRNHWIYNHAFQSHWTQNHSKRQRI